MLKSTRPGGEGVRGELVVDVAAIRASALSLTGGGASRSCVNPLRPARKRSGALASLLDGVARAQRGDDLVDRALAPST